MSGITADHILIFPESVDIQTDQEINSELSAQAQPLEMFIALNAEDALTEVLGLVLRTAVADGRITDEELLKIAPA